MPIEDPIRLKVRTELRNRLKRFPFVDIAKAGRLEITTVAAFMDGGDDITPTDIVCKLALANLILSDAAPAPATDKASGGETECDCQICTLRRTGALPGGIAVMELRITKPEPAEKTKPDPAPEPQPRVPGRWEKLVTHPATKPTIHLVYMAAVVALVWTLL